MDGIGAEVGQKMRSAIKAKLTELDCYVDDELPDYIMVMVANQRTKSQMNEDLHLFLSTKTVTFVDWLHIVLKKLKEVTVTNPEVYKKATKRKSNDTPNLKIKEEKKEKKLKTDKKIKVVDDSIATSEKEKIKSLTDDLPIIANKLSEQRRIVIVSNDSHLDQQAMSDNFDIPPLSDVNKTKQKELEIIEQQIKSVKNRLGLLVDEEFEDEHDGNLKSASENFYHKKDEVQHLDDPESMPKLIKNSGHAVNSPLSAEQLENFQTKKLEHARITFSNSEQHSLPNKKSVLDRLGKRLNSTENSIDKKTVKRASTESRQIEDTVFRDKAKEDKRDMKKNNPFGKMKDLRSSLRKNSSHLDEYLLKEDQPNKLEVLSKVYIPTEETGVKLKSRGVASVIKVKPRVIPPKTQQANKNLLLKAVADAQRSIAQSKIVGNNIKLDALFTKHYKEDVREKRYKKTSEHERNKVKKKDSSSDEEVEQEYVPQPVKRLSQTKFEYVPSSKNNSNSDEDCNEALGVKQKFIVTLDGIEKSQTKLRDSPDKPSIKSRLEGRKNPSPIIFDSGSKSKHIQSNSNIPDVLPIVPITSSKSKERCKYWPACRNGDKCEFSHPTKKCDSFPYCKFGDNCIYLHPDCKFRSSCTKRECPYSHYKNSKKVASRVVPAITPKVLSQALQTCKFFPNCTNINCSFYHSKQCKFGNFCKNQGECDFVHPSVPTKSSLTWKLK